MTPTEAYKTAEGLDAGHDEFQARVWRDIKAGAYPSISAKDGPDFIYQGAWVEVPIIHSPGSKSFIAGFADIVVLFSRSSPSPQDRHLILEIKPKIYSVGSIIRQCATLLHIARHATGWTEFRVCPVVPASDPKLALLQELSGGMALEWDWTP